HMGGEDPIGAAFHLASSPAPSRVRVKLNQRKQRTRSVPSPACGGRVGEGVSLHSCCLPPPCPSPASGGGESTECAASRCFKHKPTCSDRSSQSANDSA